MIFNVKFWTALKAAQQVIAQRDDRSLAALLDRQERSYAAISGLARRMCDEGHLDDTFVGRSGERVTLGGAIVHVVLHDAEYHM
jgi:hypothetical protein